MLLKMQNPMARDGVAWWPHGRTAQNAFWARPAMSSSTASTPEPPAPGRRPGGGETVGIHRGVGIELRVAFPRRVMEDQIDVFGLVHALDVPRLRERRLQAAQLLQQTRVAHVLIHRAEPFRILRMARPHFVTQTIGV